MKKRVLVFAEYGVRNGAENSWLTVARILKTRGWNFIVATPNTTPTEFSSAAGQDFEIASFNLHDNSGTRKSQQEIRADISQTITEVKPDLIHCNSLSTARLVGPVSSQLTVPAAGHLRDILRLSKQAITDINWLDQIIAVSDATKDFHEGQGIDAQKCTTIHNGVDLKQFRPNQPVDDLRAELGLAPETLLLACIGQIGMRKGTDVVLHAFNELAKNSKRKLFLAIVGQRNSQKQEAIEYEQRLHNLVEQYQLQNCVRFLGRRSDVSTLLGSSHLLLHAARQEPLGRVLLEAAACGCPFVATDVGGTAEIVAGLESLELTCPVDDPETMATLAGRFLENEEFHAAVSRKLRSQAELFFDAQFSAAKIERIYEELVRRSDAA